MMLRIVAPVCQRSVPCSAGAPHAAPPLILQCPGPVLGAPQLSVGRAMMTLGD